MKKCPFCAEDIQDQAIKCKHCGEFLDGPQAASHADSQAASHAAAHAVSHAAAQAASHAAAQAASHAAAHAVSQAELLRHETVPWYFRPVFIIFALASVGPLALPLIWWRPGMTLAWKTGLTAVVLLVSWVLFKVMLQSIHTIMELYQTF